MKHQFRSRKDASKFLAEKGIDTSNWSEEKWLSLNKGQAEIHMMALAEAMWDVYNESTPKQLEACEWHIPFGDKITIENIRSNKEEDLMEFSTLQKIKISTAMCARTSYTVIGEEGKKQNYTKDIELHDRMANQVPFHASPFEHCARAMGNDEYFKYVKGKIKRLDLNEESNANESVFGWCRNFKGFIQYREILEYGKI